MVQFELTPEQKQLKETARRFAAEEIIPVAGKYDEEQIFAEDVVRKAWELGLMNFAVPEELGGPGLDALDTCLVLEELNYACADITNRDAKLLQIYQGTSQIQQVVIARNLLKG
jgi:alkylation response protein AidB-like acyl-CoA dehydrogenase